MLGRDCKEGHNQICSSVEKLEEEISKIKKNAEDLGTTLKTKCNDFRNKLDEIEVNEELSEDVIEKLVKGPLGLDPQSHLIRFKPQGVVSKT